MIREIKESAAPEKGAVEQLMGIPEVMVTLKMSRDTVYRLIHEEGLPSVKIGSRHKVLRSSLDAWLKQREQSTLQQPAEVLTLGETENSGQVEDSNI